MFINNRTVFLKKKFLEEGVNFTKIELSDIHKVEKSTHIELDLIEESNPEPVDVPLRRSDKVPYSSNRYYDFLVRDGDPIELDENNEDPITYMDTVQRPDS